MPIIIPAHTIPAQGRGLPPEEMLNIVLRTALRPRVPVVSPPVAAVDTLPRRGPHF